MACKGFLQSLWEKPIWEGVWPYLDPLKSVCLRTASVEWNVPGKCGPHDELFFFLSKKEQANSGGGKRWVRVVVELLIWETRGDSVAQRVQCGKVRVKHGMRT